MAYKAILDTTILVEVLLKNGEVSNETKLALSRLDSARIPVYAIKELRDGALRAYAWMYNKLVETNSFEKALEAIVSVRMQHNLQQTAIKALGEALGSISAEKSTFADYVSTYGAEASVDATRLDECKLFLKRKIQQAWKRRRTFCSNVAHELACFPENPPQYKSDGTIDLRPYQCEKGIECCLAQDMRKDIEKLRKMRESLAPYHAKPENQKRSKALSETEKHKIGSDNKKVCKSLGDAAFSFYCEPDEIVLTTNHVDHAIIAEALGVEALTPSMFLKRIGNTKLSQVFLNAAIAA